MHDPRAPTAAMPESSSDDEDEGEGEDTDGVRDFFKRWKVGQQQSCTRL